MSLSFSAARTSEGAFTSVPATSRMVSPALRPRSAAALPGSTSVTVTPGPSWAGATLRPRLASETDLSALSSLVSVAAIFLSSGMVPILTSRSMVLPSRTMVSGTASPGLMPATLRDRSRESVTSLPSIFRMVSPCFTPAASAGESSVTSATMAPLASLRPRLSAMSSVTGWIWTPSQPRVTLPFSFRLSMMLSADDAGMAKPMPTEPPEGEKIAVLMPTTSPSRLKAGPPELPRLMAASICMKLS